MASAAAPGQPITPGSPAPDFSLPAVHREGAVSLDNYRGKSPLLLAVFRGLWCPFCQSVATVKISQAGVETLAVVATDVDNARLYFKHRPSKVPLAADPDCATHRAYGLPKAPMTPETIAALGATKVNPTGELPSPLPVIEAGDALDRLNNFQRSAADTRDHDKQVGQMKGQFLIDRNGIVRWANIEAAEGLSGIGKFPTADELVEAARKIA